MTGFPSFTVLAPGATIELDASADGAKLRMGCGPISRCRAGSTGRDRQTRSDGDTVLEAVAIANRTPLAATIATPTHIGDTARTRVVSAG